MACVTSTYEIHQDYATIGRDAASPTAPISKHLVGAVEHISSFVARGLLGAGSSAHLAAAPSYCLRNATWEEHACTCMLYLH